MNFPTSDAIYNRLRTDPNFLESKGVITYLDMIKNKYIDVTLGQWKPIKKGGDIPWHRVYFVKYNGHVIWDREHKTCTIDTIISTEIKKLNENFTVCTLYF